MNGGQWRRKKNATRKGWHFWNSTLFEASRFEELIGNARWKNSRSCAGGHKGLVGEVQKRVDDAVDGFVEVAVVGSLEKRGVDGIGDGPENVVGLAIVDYEAEFGAGIGGSVLLVGVGRTVGSGETKIEDEVG